MKIDLISDLHVETHPSCNKNRTGQGNEAVWYPWHQERGAEVLVVAGDVSNDVMLTNAVLREATAWYSYVLFVDGNHEHYGGKKDPDYNSVPANERCFRNSITKPANLTYLDGSTSLLLDGTLFIGANGWYDFQMAAGYTKEVQRDFWARESADAVMIAFGEHQSPVTLAKRQAMLLADAVAAHQDDSRVREIVVVTHTSPMLEGLITDPNHPRYPLNGAYGNTLMARVFEADRAKKLSTWIFGHTHCPQDFLRGHVRCIANPRGYGLGTAQNDKHVITIDTSKTRG